ncbi:TenA family protein [Aeromicrobium sp. CFBP 8757]|uniref:TenA family protein n=1 Tax=Aeromicrobium sp. CFBP 8757 TaxID=2775288 RepID=UPI001786BD5C|nr:TenA family protein [Aeromicrobium sp. CFBP 8757]
MSSTAQDCWTSVDDWFAAICRHPFVVGLTDGSLPEDVFVRYLVDDAHYLDRYARVLSQLASRAPDVAGIELWAASAVGAVAAERELHRSYLVPRGLDPEADAVPEASPTCVAYTGSLEAAAHSAPFDVALAAVLPCFRVYAEVGRHVMARRAPGQHPYGAWIDTYAAPEFDEAVRRAEAYLDAWTTDRDAVVAAYRRSTRFEWMFWDAAWRADPWPAPTS